MAASYQSKDSQVLQQQLKVQEVTLFANNTLLSVSGGDLVLQLNETVDSVPIAIKQVVAGTLTGLATTHTGTTITLVGEAAAVATTAYCIKYTIAENV